ncbi:zinc finger BED domain-containing protein RICESLEEPER 2-like [Senna tora]|uniref:Zinc finger BED domain-containing protein RICESLEEPER 2-like n=1 Tax=Senna tora TaxID=362788 RepID=A0A835CHA5_9FABA|nr:zinc finger BED domain-containing protein RICESLEEPER 2-like [Senna tora]
MMNPNNEQSQEQGQTQAPPTPASPSEAATTAASASAPATNSTVVGTKRKPPAHKSNVWDHFDKLPVDENNPEARAKCSYCKNTLACDSTTHGTTSLRKHVQRCKSYPYRGQEKKQPMLAFLQQPSTVGSGLTKSLVPHTYNVEECRKSLAEFVICDEMPFRVAKGHGFRKYSNCLEPRGETIGNAIEKCLLGWGIENVFPITVDNASSNDTAVTYLKKHFRNWNRLVCDGDFLHARCCAHILDLVVNDGLRDFHYSIGAIRNVVRYVRSSPARLARFKGFVEKEKIETKILVCLNVSTRWNSTYLMLEHAMKFEKVFERMEDDDEAYTSHFIEDPNCAGPPCYSDWRNASIFVQFLRVFYSITVRLSGSLYVTSNACFHDIAHVQTMLKASIAHRDVLIGGMANNMKIKYDKYWGKPENFNTLIVIGVVLDPRYKLDYVNSTFEDIYDDLQECEAMKKKVRDTLDRLYEQYSVGVVNESVEHPQESGESSTTPDADGLPMPDFVNTNPKGKWWSKKKNNAADQKSDLEKYLADEIHDNDNNFDILAWWIENANKYKILSLIARDVLDVPVSTVASESTFSTGGPVLDVFRSYLSPKMTEALICTQNWLSPTEFNFNDRDFDQYEETDSIASDVSGESTVSVDAMTVSTLKFDVYFLDFVL